MIRKYMCTYIHDESGTSAIAVFITRRGTHFSEILTKGFFKVC